jgi:hypothetical protein
MVWYFVKPSDKFTLPLPFPNRLEMTRGRTETTSLLCVHVMHFDRYTQFRVTSVYVANLLTYETATQAHLLQPVHSKSN